MVLIAETKDLMMSFSADDTLPLFSYANQGQWMSPAINQRRSGLKHLLAPRLSTAPYQGQLCVLMLLCVCVSQGDMLRDLFHPRRPTSPQLALRPDPELPSGRR